MKYDFETVLDRYDNGSVKWNLMKKKKPQVGRGIWSSKIRRRLWRR